ncbi:SOS response-associated peptidase [Paenisporosarcina indica]|uniref:SOS response-associated peptidase n=1 Tax=Paenisporosarcina indica TaxID=650093 RepID=UPI00094F5E5F|nr:SOS response-associated peptidase [Paenisporosarcina indica]
MCGRYSLFMNLNKLEERFGEATFEAEDYEPSYNIAPSQYILTVINDGSKNRLGYLKWGLVPPWAKDSKIGFKMINARSETVHEKPSFRESLKKKRCLVVADSFFEWKKTDRDKVPMLVKLKSEEPFAMAGLWETWKSSTGEAIHTCTVLTTEPNELMASIHDRMPVILKPEDEHTWLDPSIQDIKVLQHLLRPFEDNRLEAYEVSSMVNSPKNNSPALVQRVG